MSKRDIVNEVRDAFAELAGVEKIQDLTREGLNIVSPLEMLEGMREGLEVVGKKYEAGELWLSELIMAGIMSTEFTKILSPHLAAAMVHSKGKVVIGTVRGDVHDLGKNIVSMMLSSAGFQVTDLGVDVPAEKFANAVKEIEPDILGMSCLLTVGMPELRGVIAELEKQALRQKVKILVGGRSVTPEFAKDIQADGYGKDAVEAIRVATELLGGRGG